jgi:uncharacterized membrane protein
VAAATGRVLKVSVMLKEETEDNRQRVIAAVLRYGSTVSTVVMMLGVALAFLRGGAKADARPLSPGALVMKAFELDPLGVTELGILLLLLTPALRVLAAAITFGLERDLKYVLISCGVLLIVLGSIGAAFL